MRFLINLIFIAFTILIFSSTNTVRAQQSFYYLQPGYQSYYQPFYYAQGSYGSGYSQPNYYNEPGYYSEGSYQASIPYSQAYYEGIYTNPEGYYEAGYSGSGGAENWMFQEWGACGEHGITTRSCGPCRSDGTQICEDNGVCGSDNVTIVACAPTTPAPTPTPAPVPPGGPPGGPPPAAPICTISLVPSTLTASLGSSDILVATTTESNGTISSVGFVSSNSLIASVISPDLSPSFSTTVIGEGTGTATINATAVVSGPGGDRTCSTNAATDSDITITPPGAWWQAVNSDIQTDGNLISLIPTSCTLPFCNPTLIEDGAGGFPGVAVYGGPTYDFATGTSQGNTSSKNWLGNSTYDGKIFDYLFFSSRLPLDSDINSIPNTIDPTTLESGGVSLNGYSWFKTTGDTTITGDVVIAGSRRVILVVESGNLNVDGDISIASPGNGFFMVVSERDININPTISTLQGIYAANGQLDTGSGAIQLATKGSLFAIGGVILQRDLGASNSTTPAESFEYDPTLLFNYPNEFKTDRILWREVAP